MENVVACDPVEVKSNGKSVFRIVYFSQNAHEFKHYDFETEADDAGETFSVLSLHNFSGKICHWCLNKTQNAHYIMNLEMVCRD